MRKKWIVYGILLVLLGVILHLSFGNLYTLIFMLSTVILGLIIVFFGTIKREVYP